ncbi:uncharacterized protein LOC110251880, partial [Exaiptasia diaphana]|uniref:Uncharacterized protein n=1 Tax=Exaiptasia diaphana TaxID=2652724 RepID=A0A913Y3R2_EXADI
QECSVSLSGSLDSSIYTVPDPDLSQPIETSVFNSCHLNRNFTYLDCNGEWQQIQDAHYGFELVPNFIWRSVYDLHSLEETKFDDFSPSIRGKIITLRISCTRKDYCVVLKVRGKLKCPFINPTTVKPTSQYSGTVGNQSGKDNSGVIGGAIGGVIILLVAVVLIVLVMAIRRKRAANIGIQPETSHSALGMYMTGRQTFFIIEGS